MFCGPTRPGRPAAPSCANRCPPTNTVFPAGGEEQGSTLKSTQTCLNTSAVLGAGEAG